MMMSKQKVDYAALSKLVDEYLESLNDTHRDYTIRKDRLTDREREREHVSRFMVWFGQQTKKAIREKLRQ